MEAAREEPRRQLRDVEVGLDAPRDVRRPWRWVAAALAVSLCVAGAVLLTWHMQDSDLSEGGSDLQLKLRQLAGTDKAAIHLEGEYKEEISKTSVHWSDDSGHAFSQGGLELVNNEIVIPRSGLYFVYSQASFRVNCHAEAGKGDAGEVVHISHVVDRYSDSYGGKWTELVSSMRSTCRKVAGGPDSGKRWHNGIYLGAVFSLLEGDRLRTYTEKHLLPSLDWQHGKTYFGAFAL